MKNKIEYFKFFQKKINYKTNNIIIALKKFIVF